MRTVALVAGAIVALLYPIPFELAGYPYFHTVGFLVFVYGMLGVGWNIIGGWTGQFDFGPQVFFATGSYVAAVLAINAGVNAWVGMAAAIVFSVVVCALVICVGLLVDIPLLAHLFNPTAPTVNQQK